MRDFLSENDAVTFQVIAGSECIIIHKQQWWELIEGR